MSAPNYPLLAAGIASQKDLDDAGIPAFILAGQNGEMISMLDTATDEDYAAAGALTGQSGSEPGPGYLTSERLDLSNKWISVKACLDALPPVADPDPYAEIRLRLTADVQLALDAANNAGGLG